MTEPPPLIIDASVALAIARKEADGPPVADVMDRWTKVGARNVVPSHFWLEVTNALMRRHGWSGDRVFEAISEIDALELETIELDRATLILVVDISERHGLSTYDAMYLALADTLDGSLLTLDTRLRAAAGSRAAGLEGHRLAEVPATYDRAVMWPNYRGASAYLAKLRAEVREGTRG